MIPSELWNTPCLACGGAGYMRRFADPRGGSSLVCEHCRFRIDVHAMRGLPIRQLVDRVETMAAEYRTWGAGGRDTSHGDAIREAIGR